MECSERGTPMWLWEHHVTEDPILWYSQLLEREPIGGVGLSPAVRYIRWPAKNTACFAQIGLTCTALDRAHNTLSAALSSGVGPPHPWGCGGVQGYTETHLHDVPGI